MTNALDNSTIPAEILTGFYDGLRKVLTAFKIGADEDTVYESYTWLSLTALFVLLLTVIILLIVNVCQRKK